MAILGSSAPLLQKYPKMTIFGHQNVPNGCLYTQSRSENFVGGPLLVREHPTKFLARLVSILCRFCPKNGRFGSFQAYKGKMANFVHKSHIPQLATTPKSREGL